MNIAFTLAMPVYHSWHERLFSSATLHLLLCFGAIFSVVAFPFFAWRWFPFLGPYCSPLFFMALCPFIFTSTTAIVEFHHFLHSEAVAPGAYAIDGLKAPAHYALYGAAASIAAVSIYSILYAVSHNRRKSR